MPTNGLILTYFFGKVPGFNPYSTELDKENAHFALWCIFIGTAIVPVIIALALKQLKVVSSIHMPKREERAMPFILTALCYFSVYYLLKNYLNLPFNAIIYWFMYAGTLATVLGFMITLNWKVSVHMIGIGGVVGIVTVLSKIGDNVLIGLLSITIIIAGLIAFGRLKLNAHTPKQVIIGFLLGFGCEVLGLIISN